MSLRRRGGGSGVGGGPSVLGTVLRQTGQTERGLYIQHPQARVTWNLRGLSREAASAAVPATIVFENQDQDATLTWTLPLDWGTVEAGNPNMSPFTPEEQDELEITYEAYPNEPRAARAASVELSDLLVTAAMGGVLGNLRGVTIAVTADTSATLTVADSGLDLAITNAINDSTTIQDVIDAYSGVNFDLTVASGGVAGSFLVDNGVNPAATRQVLSGGAEAVAQNPVTVRSMNDSLARPQLSIALDFFTDNPLNTTLAQLRTAIIGTQYRTATQSSGVAPQGRIAAASVVLDTSGGGAGTDPIRAQTLQAMPTGGEDAEEAGAIEASLHPDDEVNGPNLLVRFDQSADTLQEIFDALTAQTPNVVRPMAIAGTDLTARPEAVPFTRPFFSTGGVTVDEITYELPAATETRLGGVRGATAAQANATSGRTFFAWSTDTLAAFFDRVIPPALRARIPSAAQVAAFARIPTQAQVDKLANVEPGAQVNVVPDWSASAASPRRIENKPGIPTQYTDLTGEVPESAIPADIARDGEVSASINAALAGKWNDHGVWGAGSAYSVNNDVDVVRHDGGGTWAAYLAIANSPAGSAATTEPAVGSQWASHWYRVGYRDGPPNALVNAAYDADTGAWTFTRESGANPLMVNQRESLLEGHNPYALYTAWPITPTLPDPIATVPAGDSLTLTVLDDIEYTPRLYGDRDVVQDWMGAIEVTVSSNVILNLLQRWDVTFASGARFVQDRIYQLRLAQNSPVAINLDLFDFRQVFASGTFPDGRGGMVTVTPEDLVRPRRLTNQLILSGRSRSNKANNADLTLTDLTVENGLLVLYQLNAIAQRLSDDTPDQQVYLYYARPALTIPADVSTNTAVPSSGTGLEFVLLDRALIEGRIYPDIDFVTQWFGGFGISFDQNGSLLVRLKTRHEFGGKEFTHVRERTRGINPNRRLDVDLSNFDRVSVVRTGTYRPPGGNSDGSDDVEITTADLAGGVRITYTVEIQVLSGAGARQNANATTILWDAPQTRSYQIDHATGGSTPGSNVRPTINRFDVTGDQSPSAGSIAGQAYDYDLAIGQSGHAESVRIVGFAGTDTNPSSVATLATIPEANFPHMSGRVTIPAGIMLAAAGDVYTIRAEVRETGRPLTASPTAYQDYRITARAAAADVRFVRVLRRVGDPGARPDATTLAANMTVMSRAGTVIGDWTVAGIPDTGAWLVGWIVPQSGAQPNHYSQGGFQIDNVVEARFALTENTVDYFVYLYKDTNDVDDSYNGSTITVT